MQRRMAREADLEEQPRILEILHPAGRGDHVARGAGQGVDDELRCRLGDARPLAGADLHQPHFPQVKQRLADRRPPDAEHPHQFALGWEPPGFGEVALVDHPFQMIDDFLIELAPFNRYDRHTGTPIIPVINVNV